MSQKIAYFNGKFVNENEVSISFMDRGFINGDTTFDVFRTFNHKPFAMEEHIDRWFRSMRYMQFEIGMTKKQVADIAIEVLKRNEKNLGPKDDYWMRMISTPGLKRFVDHPQPTVLFYTETLPFAAYANLYTDGIHVVVVSNRAIPSQCLDAKAKMYSRAHYVQADLEARNIDPAAYPLLLDIEGHATEGPRYNLFIVKDGKLLSPTRKNILEGVTRDITIKLAKEIGIEVIETDLAVYDLYNADEMFIAATSYVIMPASKFNKISLPTPVPGMVMQKLLSAWNQLVGLDIVQQAKSHLQNK